MSIEYQNEELKIFSLSSNPSLAEAIAKHTGTELGKCSVKTFSDGEIQINIEESIRGCDTYIVQSTCDPADQHIMELLIMLDALKRASAKTINVVIPYYGYARQDRKTKSREPITAKLIADLIQKAGASRVMSLDIHAPQTQGFFDVPVDQLTGFFIQASYFSKKNLEDIVVVAPDHGSVKRARQFAERLHAPIAILDRRGPRNSSPTEVNVVGDIEGKTAILIDDIVDTGRRVSTGAQALMDNGAKEVYATCTHPVLSGIARQNIDQSPLKELVVTDTIPIPEEKLSDKITQLSVAPLFSDAILRVHNQEPVSPLFED
ncbi:ribose-phosphate pyrophosphokinase [Paraliobacillus quinghaiensis]|uniref:Putative ribose-phosphate pyrophosphokinase n=1 Tax=Paraliobacillus quinghaiensis TaxID=470815 RepID=A0A917WWY4_9BACI|nr:ribose-phosphate pyrophosphokinase [Paraliobacillus quinghaiensis]GGM35643.1 ribose-phosphate pyrophosphokinase [Paraliobacillus quinghaiensis]